jgi:FkbM family methyltransferase
MRSIWRTTRDCKSWAAVCDYNHRPDNSSIITAVLITIALVVRGTIFLNTAAFSSSSTAIRKFNVDTPRTQEYFLLHKQDYNNKADTAALLRLFGYACSPEVGLNQASSHVLVGGTNDGADVVQILETCPNISFSGFEIQESFFHMARTKIQQYANAKMYNLGWDEQRSTGVRIGGDGETAGLYDPQGQHGFSMQEETTVQTVVLAEWTNQQSIDYVLYLLIDTEGYEPKVIRGMHLERKENQRKFPLFQFELGGTWGEGDNRHSGFNETWTLHIAAQKLDQWGYSLFLIGRADWLTVTPDFFDPSTRPQDKANQADQQPLVFEDEGYGMFVQGNLLAMHNEFTRNDLKEKILQESVKLQVNVE